MENQTYTVTKEVQALQAGASKDKYRSNIQAVHLNCKFATVTDGHKAIRRKLGEVDVLPGNTLLKFSSAKQKTKYGSECLTDVGGGKLLGVAGTVAEVIDHQFPNVDQIIPQEFEAPVTVCLSAKLLKEIADVMGANNGRVTLCFDSNRAESSPIIVGSNDASSIAFLMPCRGGEKNLLEKAQSFRIAE